MADHEQIQAVLRRAVSAINNRRQALNKDEAIALSKAQSAIGTRITDLDRSIASLDQSERSEIADSLKKLQDWYVRSHLLGHTIAYSSVPGIGPSLKSKLRQHGFYSAADIAPNTVQDIPGIGPQKAYALTLWRLHIEREAQAGKPTSLSQDDLGKIKSKYLARRQSLQSQKDSEQARLSTEIAAIKQRHMTERQSLDAEQTQAQAIAKQGEQGVAVKYAQEYARIAQQMAQLTKQLV